MIACKCPSGDWEPGDDPGICAGFEQLCRGMKEICKHCDHYNDCHDAVSPAFWDNVRAWMHDRPKVVDVMYGPDPEPII